MADIRRIGNNQQPIMPEDRAVINKSQPPNPAQKNAGETGSAVNLPVGQPTEGEGVINLPKPPGETAFSTAVTGKDRSQLDAAEQIRSNAGVSATDKLLGLHLQPTVAGALTAPPGNMEALRHLSPAMRRSIMRELVNKQRERTRRLAKYVRRQRERRDENGNEQENREESLVQLLAENFDASDEQVTRASDELLAMAKMLDLLDEMLNLQDYTVSQMGSFAQG